MTSERQLRRKRAHFRNLNKSAQLRWEMLHQTRQQEYEQKKRRNNDEDWD